jgi:hypothetical protein
LLILTMINGSVPALFQYDTQASLARDSQRGRVAQLSPRIDTQADENIAKFRAQSKDRRSQERLTEERLAEERPANDRRVGQHALGQNRLHHAGLINLLAATVRLGQGDKAGQRATAYQTSLAALPSKNKRPGPTHSIMG